MSQLSIHIKRRLDSLSSRPNRPFIFRVNDKLRKQNQKAYEPEILAVGPYHRGKVNLKIMEEHKLWYLKEFLERERESVDKYVKAIEKLEKKARECYAEPIKLKKEEFVEMMLLDGGFIIELFHKIDNRNFIQAHDPIFQNIMFDSIQHDLLLFENQIPLSILQLFVPLNILVPLALNFFRGANSYFPPSQISDNQAAKIPTDKDNHLLGLVHDTWFSSIAEKRTSPEIDTNHGCIKDVTKVLESAIKSKKCKKNSLPHDIDLEKGTSPLIDTNLEFIKSVTELREAGIKFKKKESSALLDVKFENGIMEIPSLLVSNDTEWLFRNLIAYEQYSGGNVKTYMTDYATLMDCLLNSPKDVEILRHSGIINNWSSDDKVVSTMFNKMCNYIRVDLDPKTFYYGEVFKEVIEYCKHRHHGWMAYLRYNYCNSPWTILSVIVASVFLLLTVIQTGCSVLQV